MAFAAAERLHSTALGIELNAAINRSTSSDVFCLAEPSFLVALDTRLLPSAVFVDFDYIVLLFY